MRRTATSALAILLAAACLAFGACILTPAGIQFLELTYKLSAAIAAGEESLAHLQVFPGKVVLKKYFVRVSGRVTGADDLPDRIQVLVASENETGKVYDRATFDLRLGDDGGFVVTRKWKKNIEAGTTQSIFVTPIGADLPNGVEVKLCVHVTKKKATLEGLADCSPGSFTLPAAFALELDSVGFHEFFTVGGAFPRDLGPTEGRRLVVALRDKSRPRQTCPRDDVPWDGCASVDWDDVDGTRNAPPGGGYFENKIWVRTEDGPLELYLNRSLGLEREIDDDFALG